jgi:acyl-CoA thioesterase
MSTLATTLSNLTKQDGDYIIEAPQEWAQGRTLFGGMTAALSYTAILRDHVDLGPLRSAQFTFVGPASGQLRFQSRLLRRGRSAAFIGAECWNAESLAAQSTFVFAESRESEVLHDYTPPMNVPPPEDCSRFHQTDKPLTGFLDKFEFRFAGGSRLLSRTGRPEFSVWVRLRDPNDVDPVAALLALADALPCAAMSAFSKPAAISTVTWAVDFHGRPAETPPIDAGGWHLVWSSSESAADGYSLQNMRVYDRAGTPLISSRQLVSIFI